MPFLPEPAILIAFFLASIVLIATPGPDMTLFLGKTLSQGRTAGLVSMFGAACGIVVHTLFAAFGLSAILASSAYAFGLLKIVGALYLLWLAWDAIRNGSSLSLKDNGRKREPLRDVFLKGVGINLLNPKILLFFLTFLPQFVAANDPFAAQKLVFFGFAFIAIAVPLCMIVILLADAIAERVQRSPRITRVLDWLFAGVFAAFAVRLLLEPSRS